MINSVTPTSMGEYYGKIFMSIHFYSNGNLLPLYYFDSSFTNIHGSEFLFTKMIAGKNVILFGSATWPSPENSLDLCRPTRDQKQYHVI